MFMDTKFCTQFLQNVNIFHIHVERCDVFATQFVLDGFDWSSVTHLMGERRTEIIHTYTNTTLLHFSLNSHTFTNTTPYIIYINIQGKSYFDVSMFESPPSLFTCTTYVCAQLGHCVSLWAYIAA